MMDVDVFSNNSSTRNSRLALRQVADWGRSQFPVGQVFLN
jgi:hypothetical protein